MNRKIGHFLLSLTLGITLSLVTAFPLKASERLHFIYGPINLSLGIDSLQKFAETGEVNQDLGFYFRIAQITEEERVAFRDALNKRVDVIDPIYISRFFNSSLGEELLSKIGSLVQIRGGRNGKFAIRGALIQAALDTENGLTLMNFLSHLPTHLQLDLESIQGAANIVDALDSGTRRLTAEMAIITAELAQKEPSIDFSTLPNLYEPGPYSVGERQEWTLTNNQPNNQRNRTFRVILYRPEKLSSGKTPIIIISHGLASRPEDFEHWGRHLASYGYVVALPQHIGSDTEQLMALFNGLSSEVFEIDEFVNRPLDVSYVLDELGRRNLSEFEGRLDLNNVGVAGHSFGGFNMLVLGGATLDFKHLEQVCNAQTWNPNLSLILQCRALGLPQEQKNLNLKDQRVKAIFLLNPVSGEIFGARGFNNLEIPVIFGAGSSDPATPAAVEQLRAFVWTKSKDKYFVLVRGQAHVNFSQLDAQTQELLETFENLTLPQQSILEQYVSVYLVSFFGRYLLNDTTYAPFLTPAFSEFISRPPNEVYLVDQRAEVRLSELFNRYRPRHRPTIHPPQR